MAISNGTSTDHADLLTKLEKFLLGDHVVTVAIVAAGTGFIVGEIVTLTDGTFDKAARFKVMTIGGGGTITGIRIIDGGAYSVNPDLTATTSWTTSGAGTGATFDLSMEVSDWVKRKDDATLDSSTERVLIFQETGNDVFIGFRSYTQVTGAQTAKNWIVFGMSSYNSGLPWYQQPDASPSGFSTVDGSVLQTTAGGSFFVAKSNDGFPMTYWFNVTNRRVMVFAKLNNATITTSRYSSLHAGLLNPFGTNAEFPYPLYVAGSSAGYQTSWNDLVPAFQFSGLSQAIGLTGRLGPGFYYHNDGAWKSVHNTLLSAPGSSSRSVTKSYTVYPSGLPDPAQGPDVNIVIDDSSTGLQWGTLIQTSQFTAATMELWPTPDSGSLGDKRMLVPCTIILSASPDVDIAGELDGLYFVSAAGAVVITSEDTVDDGSGNLYMALPNGVYNQLDGYMAVRQD